QMQGMSGDKPQDDQGQEDASTPLHAQKAAGSERAEPPRKHVRTCVASMDDVHAFGPMVAAEAQQRDFYRAKRGAFLGDGAAYNWTIHHGYFWFFEPITDLLHVLCYIYLASWGVGADETQRWSIYVSWLQACWQGRVTEVIEELGRWQERIGSAPE